MFKIKKAQVNFPHEIDGKHGVQESLKRTPSAEPNASLPAAADATGNPNRLTMQFNVGKRPEVQTRSVESHATRKGRNG